MIAGFGSCIWVRVVLVNVDTWFMCCRVYRTLNGQRQGPLNPKPCGVGSLAAEPGWYPNIV